MTSRFERLTLANRIILISLLTILPTLLLPQAAMASTDLSAIALAKAENKTRQVLEIKNFQTITIPNIQQISDFIDNNDNDETVAEPEPIVDPAPAPVVIAPKQTIAVTKSSYSFPPKILGDDRVYMHEPEIRAYVCPKMGLAQCEIFIAVLKGENGTHECTRDNRGVNRNGSLDVGLAQINWNPKYHPPYSVEQLRDCKFNLDIALLKYKARGFQPWYAYTKGTYKKFLKPVAVAPVAKTIE